jgi:trk system potassium uptake protein TrkA
MNIIIIGDGKVGSTLAKVLSKEGNAVTIIDKNANVLNQTSDDLEVIFVEGSGLNIKTLHEADVMHADLVIAVTNQDEINMICCLYAKRMGAKYTIARIRDPEHSKEVNALMEELGLDQTINPEYAAAIHISRLLLWPNVSNIELFADNRVILTKYKIYDKSPLINRSLNRITDFNKANILVAAIERSGHTLIPKGDFIFKKDDNIFIIGEANSVNAFLQQKNKHYNRLKDVMIIGGGRIGIYLTQILSETKIKVKIIEQNPDKCVRLSQLFPDVMVINGDGTDYDFLEFEDMHSTDAFITLMGHDEANIISSLIAKKAGAEKTIAKVTRIKGLDIIEDIGIDSIISPKLITANHILRYARNFKMKEDPSINQLYMMNENNMQALEFAVEHDYDFLNIPLKDLKIKNNVLIAVIARDNKIIVPRGDDYIQLNDSIIVITSQPHMTNLTEIL